MSTQINTKFKACAKCVYFNNNKATCNRSNPIAHDIVTGKTQYGLAKEMRDPSGLCGPEARLYANANASNALIFGGLVVVSQSIHAIYIIYSGW